MSEEAMTSELEPEGTTEVSDSSEGAATDGDEGTKEVSDPEIPDEVKSEFEKIEDLEKRELFNKEYKRFLTKRTQKEAEERRGRDSEAERLRAEHASVSTRYKELNESLGMILKDPEYYNELRSKTGYDRDDKKSAVEERPPIKTAEDMINYVQNLEKRLDDLQKGIPAQASAMSKAELEKYQVLQKHELQVNQYRQENPVFKKYEPYILHHMRMKGWDKEFDQNNVNSYALVKKATDDYYNSFLKGDIESSKQELLESLKAKKSSTTLSPQKKASTSNNKGSLDSTETIAARVREKYGSFG